jgi:VWFA-related protein
VIVPLGVLTCLLASAAATAASLPPAAPGSFAPGVESPVPPAAPVSEKDEAIRLVSPGDAWWIGSLTFIAHVRAPANDAVRDVEFFLDGHWLGTVIRPPWRVDHVFRGPVAAHSLQIVARLRSGGRITRTFVTTPPEGVREEAGVDLVLVPVIVADPAGLEVRGLEKDDFEISDGGQHTPIVSLDQDPPPGSVVLALDRSESMRTRFAIEQAAAIGFLKSIPKPCEVAVLRFGDKTATLSDWTRDRTHAAYAVNAPDEIGPSNTALLSSVGSALDLLETRGGRSILVYFTDAVDSVVPAEQMDGVVHDLVSRARACSARVYAIVYGQPGKDNPLVRIANQTGGAAFQAGSTRTLRAAYARMARELLPPYVLAIKPSREGRSGEWRKLDVRLRGDLAERATIVTARTGYVRP